MNRTWNCGRSWQTRYKGYKKERGYKPNTHIEVLPRSKSNCSGALFYYLSAQIKQNSVFYANFQNRIINRFFGQAFSRKKSLRVEGGALVALRRERNPHTSCAPQGVNSKKVRWTVLEEGTPCKRGRAPLKHNFTILLYKHCSYIYLFFVSIFL